MTYKEALGVFEMTEIPSDTAMLSKKYKQLMRKWHPDLSDAENAHEMSQKIKQAYDILTKGTAGAANIPQYSFPRYTHKDIFTAVRVD